MPKKILTVLFFMATLGFVRSQTCIISATNTKVCHGSSVGFSVTWSSGTPASFEWDFGNGVKNFQQNPSYVYPIAGTYTPNIKITFTNSAICQVNGPLINVVAKPIADFYITSDDTQCFKNNMVCLQDTSRPGTSGAPLVSRLFLWGDGNSDISAITVKNLCHNYTSQFGGAYTLVMEVTDTNGCVGRLQKDNSAKIWPKMDGIGFQTTYTVQCNATPVTFNNTSVMPQSKVKKFRWIFDDGSVDSTNSKWASTSHIYAQSGFFSPSLAVEDINGCFDTFTYANGAQNMRLDSFIVMYSVSKCFSKQNYVFYTLGSTGANILWRIYDPAGNLYDSVWAPQYSQVSKRFNCGQYKVRTNLSFGNCSRQIDTFVDIFGPNTIIYNDTNGITNSTQCHPQDTVYFRTPPKEISCFYQNVLNWHWDFGDPLAPPCTTDTRLGINVGINCRFSKDDKNVKHKYPDGMDNCYKVKLLLTDTQKGCSDLDSATISLMPPNAHPDLSATPPRRGLYFYTLPPGNTLPPQLCFDNLFVFRTEETLPLCGKEKIWINVDSGYASWDTVDVTKNYYVIRYQKTFDPKGWVTTGLIVKNGDCYDTAWYHHMFQILDLNSHFSLKIEGTCAPFKATVSLKDSIQDSLLSATFNFGDGFATLNFAPGDSVIPSQTFYYTKPGKKTIFVTLRNRKGCMVTSDTTIFLGYWSSIEPSKGILCLRDSVTLMDSVVYFSAPDKPYWRDPLRIAAGKEKMFWDFGDGTLPFAVSGPAQKYKYSRIGNYRIRLATVDSIGCRDTAVFDNIKVVDVKAGIAPLTGNLICAPKIVSFNDQSFRSDSSFLYGQAPYDTILYYVWDFGDLKPKSILRDPVHDYTQNGLFSVSHVVITQNGCIDTVVLNLNIKGPKPGYKLLSGDTIGCSPVEVTFKNTTGNIIKQWIWQIDGPVSSTSTTDKDTNTTFRFTKAGVYRILLIGIDTVTNPITMQTFDCAAIAPDTLNPNTPPVYVTVFDKPFAKLSAPDSVCKNEAFTLIVSSDPVYNKYRYDFGDTTFSVPTRDDDTLMYLYRNAGQFNIRLYPTPSFSILCIDSPSHPIKVLDIKADFDIDETNAPVYSFTNTSQFANSYKWDFGQPSSGPANVSFAKDPTHNYQSLNDSFVICLWSTSPVGCTDSLCKAIAPAARLLDIPNVFTPNNDGKNDAFDIMIQGYTSYHLKIYNRWGGLVYESEKDGTGNDGINWNGLLNNDGTECSEGVYYYLFTYKLYNNPKKEQEVHGTITLLRN